ncbi:hypothetical protein BK126_06200 [Paenibacillus sp. FSL H7-0326]|uniref:DUF4269 domain-containing protein n=1 Tax=Paenibacillus sp. FSL H7-0326 TaxID=1921144 RepID=UPI00096D835B|nr:DUF4269 domain-containing protein [Paenibacillus sp. FSL H7-0326]OMC71661.1 hypothetical protein BK126_06200 [Paenibacillus sp. FSL H7-0326]
MQNKHLYKDIRYLIEGNEVQQEVYRVLTQFKIMDRLQAYDPILTGTVPIAVDIEGSDLDIICEVHDFSEFNQRLTDQFGEYEGFKISEKIVDGIKRMKASFRLEGWGIEVFGQPIPTSEQNAYRHMLIEDRVLKFAGEDFRSLVVSMKRKGTKTEPAFSMLLGLEGKGNAYEAMFEIENWTDEQIKQACVVYESSSMHFRSLSELVKKSKYSYKPSKDHIDPVFGPDREYSFQCYIDDHIILVSRGVNEDYAHVTIHGKDEFTFKCTLIDVRKENPSLIQVLKASVIEDYEHEEYEYADTMPYIGAVEVRDVEWICHLPEEPKELGEKFFTFVSSFLLNCSYNLSADIKELEPVKEYIKKDLQFMLKFPFEGKTYIRTRQLW